MHIPRGKYILKIDGACRHLLYEGAIGAVLQAEDGIEVASIGVLLGEGFTNNTAEYKALLIGLQMACRFMPYISKLRILGNSQLLIQGMTSAYHIKDKRLLAYMIEIHDLVKNFQNVEWMHIPRLQNRRADELADLAYSRDHYWNCTPKEIELSPITSAGELWTILKTQTCYGIRWIRSLIGWIEQKNPELIYDLKKLMNQQLTKTCFKAHKTNLIGGLMHPA